MDRLKETRDGANLASDSRRMENSAGNRTKYPREETGTGNQREQRLRFSREREEHDRHRDRDEHSASREFSSESESGCDSGSGRPAPGSAFAPRAARPQSLAKVERRRHEKGRGRIETDD